MSVGFFIITLVGACHWWPWTNCSRYFSPTAAVYWWGRLHGIKM